MGRLQPSHVGWQRNASQDLVDAIREGERQSLTLNLHDTVVQPLTVLFTSMQCMPYHHPNHEDISSEEYEAYISDWKELVREALDSLRGMLAGLQTHPHADLGLPKALRRYLVPRLWSNGQQITLDVVNWPDNLPLDVTSSLYLAVREALTNAEKYSHASKVCVVLRATPHSLSVVVSDNGIGMDKNITRKPYFGGGGYGIVGMRARARRLGGKLFLSTALGHGLRIEIRVPWCPQVCSVLSRDTEGAVAGG